MTVEEVNFHAAEILNICLRESAPDQEVGELVNFLLQFFFYF